MKNVIIFGTGATSKIVVSGLKDDVNIVCYFDNDKSKWKQMYNNRQIFSPAEVKKIKFEYILIASQFNDEIYNQLIELNVQEEKIFQFFKCIDSFWNYVQFDIQNLLNNKEKVEGIITGISYAERGIKEELITKKFIKMARHSQDLYYDYNLVKYAIEKNKEQFTKLKYVLITLNYYSFQYDMSYSSMKGKVPLYYEVMGKEHHLVDIERYVRKGNNNKVIAKDVFNLNSNGYPQIDWTVNCLNKNSNIITEEDGKKQALLDGNKNYPETVEENTQILQDYLDLLDKNNIKAIIVVCPVSRYYSKYFSKSMKEQFYSILNGIKNQYSFQFIDYFDNQLFKDSDFYDVSHLNSRGAEKFTVILNNDIGWC